jgi:hypothetical protein
MRMRLGSGSIAGDEERPSMRNPLAPAAVAILLLCNAAQATVFCTPLEYAAYKDQAKTRTGRWSLAIDACSAKRYAELPTATPSSARDCNQQRATIMAVLANAKDAKSLAFVRDGCEGDYDKAGVK